MKKKLRKGNLAFNVLRAYGEGFICSAVEPSNWLVFFGISAGIGLVESEDADVVITRGAKLLYAWSSISGVMTVVTNWEDIIKEAQMEVEED